MDVRGEIWQLSTVKEKFVIATDICFSLSNVMGLSFSDILVIVNKIMTGSTLLGSREAILISDLTVACIMNAISLKASMIRRSFKVIQVLILCERFPDSVTQIQRDKMTEANRNRTRKAQRDDKSAFMLGFFLSSYLLFIQRQSYLTCSQTGNHLKRLHSEYRVIVLLRCCSSFDVDKKKSEVGSLTTSSVQLNDQEIFRPPDSGWLAASCLRGPTFPQPLWDRWELGVRAIKPQVRSALALKRTSEWFVRAHSAS